MYPVFLSFGPVKIFSLSIFLILAWLFFSFVFWRKLRSLGTEEVKIFDLTFYATLNGLLFARAGFIVIHPELFADSALKIFAIWVAPGLSFWGALIGIVLTFIYLSKRYKIRLGYMLDALALSLTGSMIIGKVGSLLDGAEVGKIANLPWSVHYIGHVGMRHPIQAYELMVLVLIALVMSRMERLAAARKWSYGMLAIWLFMIASPLMFLLEFFKDSSVYWFFVTPNQWLLVAIFAQSLGALYVRGGGREALRPIFWHILRSSKAKLGEIYAKISKRSSGRN